MASCNDDDITAPCDGSVSFYGTFGKVFQEQDDNEEEEEEEEDMVEHGFSSRWTSNDDATGKRVRQFHHHHRSRRNHNRKTSTSFACTMEGEEDNDDDDNSDHLIELSSSKTPATPIANRTTAVMSLVAFVVFACGIITYTPVFIELYQGDDLAAAGDTSTVIPNPPTAIKNRLGILKALSGGGVNHNSREGSHSVIVDSENNSHSKGQQSNRKAAGVSNKGNNDNDVVESDSNKGDSAEQSEAARTATNNNNRLNLQQEDDETGTVPVLRTRNGGYPHLFIILADDLGYNDVGYAGDDFVGLTDHLDALRADGISLETYYSMHLCTPSRSSLLTGRYAYRTGMQMEVIKPWEAWGMPTGVDTLPQLLKDEAGYTTHMIGKWHLGHAFEEMLPTARGFDTFYGFLSDQTDYKSHVNGDTDVLDFLDSSRYGYDAGILPNGSGADSPSVDDLKESTNLAGGGGNNRDRKLSNAMVAERLIKAQQEQEQLLLQQQQQKHQGKRGMTLKSLSSSSSSPMYSCVEGKEGVHNTRLHTGRTLELLKNHVSSYSAGDRTDTGDMPPLFMYLAYQYPHYPLQPDADVETSSVGKILHAVGDKNRMKVAKMVFDLDRQVELLVDSLKQLDLYDDSVIVFMSDNGGCPQYGTSNYPLRGTKHHMFEGSSRVRAFVHSPLFPADVRGSSYSGLFHVTDWLPTLLDAIGVRIANEGGIDSGGVGDGDGGGAGDGEGDEATFGLLNNNGWEVAIEAAKAVNSIEAVLQWVKWQQERADGRGRGRRRLLALLAETAAGEMDKKVESGGGTRGGGGGGGDGGRISTTSRSSSSGGGGDSIRSSSSGSTLTTLDGVSHWTQLMGLTAEMARESMVYNLLLVNEEGGDGGGGGGGEGARAEGQHQQETDHVVGSTSSSSSTGGGGDGGGRGGSSRSSSTDGGGGDGGGGNLSGAEIGVRGAIRVGRYKLILNEMCQSWFDFQDRYSNVELEQSQCTATGADEDSGIADSREGGGENGGGSGAATQQRGSYAYTSCAAVESADGYSDYLFDLHTDPYEQFNLIDQDEYQMIAAEMYLQVQLMLNKGVKSSRNVAPTDAASVWQAKGCMVPFASKTYNGV